VTCIAAKSGGFNARGTWLGGIVPSFSFCDSIGGCGLYIASGCDLDTSELNGQLDINFNEISVASGGTFSLGTSGLTRGFRFWNRCNINIRGTLNFVSAGGSIYLPWGCGFNFFTGARFSSNFAVDIRTFNLLFISWDSLIISLSSSFTGSYFASISSWGIKTETTGGKNESINCHL